MPASEDLSVNYSVKELIARVDVKLDVVLGLLAEKADRASVERLDGRVTMLEAADTTSQAVAKTSREFADRNRYYIFAAVPATIGVAVAISTLIH